MREDDPDYEGPDQGDLDDLATAFDDAPPPRPARRNGVPEPTTLDEVFALANQQRLDPFRRGTKHPEVVFWCPICQQHGKQATATAEMISGVLTVDCAGCHDAILPGIRTALAVPPSNVIPMPGVNGNGTHPDATATLAWTPLDLVTLGDTPRIPPAISGLLYPKRKHIYWGESESGKTWAAIAAAADELLAGHGVIWADLDFMGAQDILERLRQFGVPDDTIRRLFVFYQPDGPLEGYSLDAVKALIEERNARLVVIDAFTGLCTLHALNPEKTMDIDKAYNACQPLCELGAAVLILDHVVKNADNRGQYAIGAERKRSGADVAIGFTLIEHYGRGRTGRARLVVHKDRPAMLKRPVLGIFTLKSHPDTHQVTWSLDEDHTKGTDGVVRLTGYMERISIYLEAQLPGHAVGSSIESDVTGNATHIRSALKTLVTEGYVHLEVSGKAHHFTSLKHYREANEDT